ncbi:hypothetical protein QBC34DRAFT_401275 [Podospora aff. communis PSN243]|uniref:GATA-type domain-containing protein n=1 Tax=Podospora aff. communis PSN243 TaxID=3040156 RepID=A0AAV9GV96_9PEZI|nr:hypothetical protein QBC34DRAFT_401275 [Podospora aff. communis PSN243]
MSKTNNNRYIMTLASLPTALSPPLPASTSLPNMPAPIPQHLSFPSSPPCSEPQSNEPDVPSPEESHLFGIEKAFWKIQNSAQELLRFASTYQQHRDLVGNRPDLSPLPREIDMLSMTQLSWGILHAVSDINNHNQRLLASRHGLAWRRRQLQQPRYGMAANRVKKEPRTRRVMMEKANNALNGCLECGADESPRWRRGPSGALTLCNVCGLLFAKRAKVQVQVQGEIKSERSGGCD